MYGENLLNGGDTLAKKGSMTSEASSRIQSNADKTVPIKVLKAGQCQLHQKIKSERVEVRE
ncbi:hypothetical protein METP1_03078 [Methanosarcinales archaeon]|nr:hypothetical protein METP1_03078 [Methanosarcinales archaeon]